MALFLFTDAILNQRPIQVFNNGNLSRDFTYIDDIIAGVTATLENDISESSKYEIYNIGNSQPVKLMDFIKAIEKATGKTAKKDMKPMQHGDVYKTYADVSKLQNDYKYKPNTQIKTGVDAFVKWYRKYYNV